MNPLWAQLFVKLDDVDHVVRVVVRLGVAIIMGGVIGYERQHEGKSAGMRTHMLVALGAAIFTLIPQEADIKDLTRVIQGIAAGIGFLGAGTIIKLSDSTEIRGLNSAATIWLTAAVGMAVAAGWIWPSVVAVVMAWLVLAFVHKLEPWLGVPHRHEHETHLKPESKP
jgi:putative Mg2+ transporter-C (MgtC) family protein